MLEVNLGRDNVEGKGLGDSTPRGRLNYDRRDRDERRVKGSDDHSRLDLLDRPTDIDRIECAELQDTEALRPRRVFDKVEACGSEVIRADGHLDGRTLPDTDLGAVKVGLDRHTLCRCLPTEPEENQYKDI